MTTNIATELLSLIKDSREHLTYFQELGIELVEPDAKAPAPVISTEPERAIIAQTAATKPTNATARREVTKPLPQGSPAGAALFQDLAPEPERLAKSNETLEEIHAEIGDCTRCPLFQGRTHVVHTEGNRKARLMFVGEAPGADEDAQARPFVGRAGQLLTKIIEAIGYKREEVLIGNINRCRPPGNRPPTAEEAAVCKPFLLREIAAVQPEVIVVLGNTAMKNLLETKEGITRLRGQFQNYKGSKIMPTFHPAYLLRDPSKKKETWDDLKKVRDFLDKEIKHDGAR
jgi:uracil-DNA glycosylase